MKIRKNIILSIISLITQVSCEEISHKDHSTRQYFAIESNLALDKLINLHPSWKYEHNVRGLENHYVFSVATSNLQKRQDYSLYDDVLSFQDLPGESNRLFKRMAVPPMDSSFIPIKEAEERLHIDDPLFEKQWHLINPAFKGNDVNVQDVWYQNITGKGVVAAVVDDGLDYENPDIKDNFCKEGSWDFNANTNLPKPTLADDYHGTRCAGEIAAVKNNGICGIGVAYDAKVAGIRILSGEITAEDEAAALINALDINDIYSCSWGPQDDGTHLQGPSDLVKKALIKGVNDGRKNKGAIYVFASGNGGSFGDNCNYDGYTNSIYSITVGAIDHKDLHPPYSESCSAVMVVTYSSGSGEYIHTTDINNKCNDRHGGTSAAAPLAAGIYTLLLQANPNLTWRDVQYLSILSSKEITNSDADSQMGALKKRYSHRYGYGKLDALALIEMAKDWENVNPQSWYYGRTVTVDKSTTSPSEMLESEFEINEEDLKRANLKRVEHVTVTVSIESDSRGSIIVDLISPSGMVSHLGVVRERDKSKDGFKDWTFMSIAHWGESGVGKWKLQVRTAHDSVNVNFRDWRLKFFGESLNPDDSVKFEFGNDKEGDVVVTSTMSPSTSITTPTPVSSTSIDMTVTSVPTSTSRPDHNTPKKISRPEDAMHYFIGVFILGCVFLSLYFSFFVKSRRRIRRSRAEAYEFDIIDTESDFDSTVDNSMTSNTGMDDAEDIEDFDFDLSDEDVNLTQNTDGIDTMLTMNESGETSESQEISNHER
ncbi:hypothetical protein KAFR_0A08040 [Kazachstania africana CBS 2517]|uniref:P/Homo B domain-containing protein n=1 Tax=Kazachstania africana (strain ATCC 22294 / BCRC 22015 / CBS 2517 / CECT 1963 / NBRC 1671 / NRRL Y-8276) TaxID=1071382 RepID=H2APD8_KAZAF|nr:hypothetical protein KAFR_0A08040 [Kazachstania africana CBS 2517]CCF56238.1 hypothetical protein KAFR_0A08040 [Kazachstania africana CBS 2517]